MSLTSDPPVDKAPPPTVAEPVDYGALKVVPVRHPWRWAAVAATAILLVQFLHGLATNPGWEWEVFAQFFTAEAILKAVWITIQLTFCGTVIGFALGIVLAFMRLSASPFLKRVAVTYIWAFRSIPLMGLSSEAVAKSEINPLGLPKTKN